MAGKVFGRIMTAPGAYRMAKSAPTAAEIYLYDEIGTWGVTAQQFANDLKALGDVKTILLRINSPGGDVFDGRTIYTLLAQHPAVVTCCIDGVAASAASLIAMVGNTIKMADGAFIMIHNPYTMTMGDAAEHIRQANLLQTVADSMVKTYAARTGQAGRQIQTWMDQETWMDGDTALKNGFCNEVVEPMQVAASCDPTRFRKLPAALVPKPRMDSAASRMAAALARGANGGVR